MVLPQFGIPQQRYFQELAEDSLDPIIPVIKEHVNWYWLQCSSLKDTSSKLVASQILYH